MKRWLKRHPRGSFADYYVARNEARTRAGRPHPTLGDAGYKPGDRRAVRWNPATFRERGRDLWAIYRDQGLLPSMRTVDYGCGSLRIGQHAIEFLDRGCYWGIDPSETFIEQGLGLVDPALVSDRQPRLDRLDAGAIERIGKWEPQFVFSHAVLQHVPRAELRTYFRRLGEMMNSPCKAVIMFPHASKEKRIKAMSWAYPPDLLEELASAAIPGARIRFAALPRGKEGVAGGGRRLMIIEKDEAGHEQSD